MRDGWRRVSVTVIVTILALTMVAQPARAEGNVHIVRRGETLSSIAARYGITVQSVVKANGLPSANLIYVGQRLTIPSGAASGGTSATGSSYTVRRGDTLSSIARRNGTTVSALVRANGLRNANMIFAGQRILIPGVSASSGEQGNSSGKGKTYIVRKGDTLASIAYRHGTTAAAIASANGLRNPNLIYRGQKLLIPSGGGAAAPPPSGGGKRIVVDLSEQRMYVYQGGQLLWNWVVSTGRPGQATAVGSYKVLNKIRNAWASTWGLQMPYWLGIYWAGSLQNGIHALPIMSNGQTLWAGYLGQRVSFGCIILSTEHARTLYNWASVGTRVDVVW